MNRLSEDSREVNIAEVLRRFQQWFAARFKRMGWRQFGNGGVWSNLVSKSGLGRSEIHSSLLLTLFLISTLVLALSFVSDKYGEFRTAAITLPIVWLASLVVRIAAQHLAIGDFSHDSDTTICPTGNMQTDYEYLPPRAILAYGVAGQLASIGMMSVGLVINAAMTSGVNGHITASDLLDAHGGWSSQAWASQIFWVNVFLFGLHLLPTVPFDMRALVFSFFSWRSRTAQEPHVYRSIASFDSHLSAIMFGIGIASIVLGWIFSREVAGWYASVAAAVYLFVASQWENSRAEELEEQYVPKSPREHLHRAASTLKSHLEFELQVGDEEPDPDNLITKSQQQDAEDFFVSGDAAPQYAPLSGEAGQLGARRQDIDEILRKVYRDGYQSLTEIERQALLSASKEIKEKRGST